MFDNKKLNKMLEDANFQWSSKELEEFDTEQNKRDRNYYAKHIHCGFLDYDKQELDRKL